MRAEYLCISHARDTNLYIIQAHDVYLSKLANRLLENLAGISLL